MPKLEIWGMEETFLTNYLNNRALSIIKIQGKEEKKAIVKFTYPADQDDPLQEVLKIEDDTAHLFIDGPLSNEGPDAIDRMFGWGGTGYRQIIAAADRIESDRRVKNVEMHMDTPGGRFKGVDNAWKKIMALREGRNITAINEGLLASAGYYIASAAHEIHSTSETNEVGSIGVMVAGTDWSKYDKEKGIQDVVIVSKNAPKKHVDIGTEKGQNILQERVDDAEAFFLDRISAGRKVSVDHIIENYGQGGLLYSKSPVEGKPDALSVGMIDKIINISGETGENGSPVSINIKQEKSMDLTALLATDQEAKAEYDRVLASAKKTAFNEGKSEGRAEVIAESERVFAFMKADGPYAQEKTVQEACVAVLKGEEPLSNVTNLVRMVDKMNEGKNSKEAKKESKETGDTPPDHDPDPNPDGKIKNKESMDAAVKTAKNYI
jgi:ClpP class serine protease